VHTGTPTPIGSATPTGTTETTTTLISSNGAQTLFKYAGPAQASMGSVSVGGLVINGVTTVRQIQNVAAGDITATSTDAVNGSQLYATNTNLASLTTRVASMSGGGTVSY
jgi:autotransporter adhesin